ncbi:interleukin 17-like protein [Octopus bimaculoides]|uniref:Interleukin 17-like protein n=1 Tax=Octopus bimaculoides TaxID=37653 RepID=A0A0L8HU97_OCTBM|nr:interleukin 17-like protein [Octopus bimaculoides]|eukprot:XP_014769326.1 PREDICTED: interleukin 17-like protein [Octopus bimaculoides]
MNTTNVLLQAVIFLLTNVVLFISSASIPTQCKIPKDLKVQYEKLSSAAIGNNFFLPAEIAPAGSDQQELTEGDKTCPTSPVSTDIIRERSTCPWYLKITHNSTYFPPSRTEVVCRCTDCLDSDSNHQCVMVYTPTTVLKRTVECIDGLYVYQPSVIHVATACVCARKIDIISGGNGDEYES